MFGSHFYHATVRKSVAVFGTLFNNILVARKKGDGSIINQVKVPLAYGPKQKFLSRIDSDSGQDASVAIKLPRMSFEITGIELDASKKLQKRSSINEPTSSTTVTQSSSTVTEIWPLFDGGAVTLTNYATDYTDSTGTAKGNFAGQKRVVLNHSFGNITGSSELLAADEIYILLIFPLDGTHASGYNTPAAVGGGNSNITEYKADTRYLIRFDLPNNAANTHPYEAGSSLDPTKVGLRLGSEDLKASEAFAVYDGSFVFSQQSTQYVWEYSQAQMDALYDTLALQGGALLVKELRPFSWNNTVEVAATAITSRRSIKQQVPYNINMQLNIMAKNQDDGLQILEQILPYFQPEYTLSIKPIDEMQSFKQDVPIILNSVSFDDQYEGDFNSRRVLIYTLDFTMKMSFYGSLVNPKVIREINIDFVEDRTFGAVINLPAASAQLSYPTLFVPGATIYQGSNASRTWESTIDSLTSTQIRLFENNTTGYIAGARLYVTTGGVTQNIEAANNSITLRTDLNTLAELDVKIGLTDIETDYTLTTTFTTSDFE